MTKYREILNFISTIRNSFPLATEVYTRGSCFQFYLILKRVYPEAQCYYNIDHIITKIDDKFYDITGIIYDTKSYRPIGEFDRKGVKYQVSRCFWGKPICLDYSKKINKNDNKRN